MTVLFNNFESPSSGTTLTTGNTSNADGSSAFDTISIGAGGTLVADTTHTVHGQALKVASGGTAAQTFAWWQSTTAPFTSANGTIWGRIYCYFTANPSSAFPVVQLLDNGSNFGGRVTINTSGKIVMNFGGSNSVATTSTNAIPLNAWFRLEFKLVCSTTVGQTEVKIFTTSADGTTPDETNTSAASLNTTITACQGARVGLCAATASLGPAWLDAVAFSDTGYIGPFGNSATVIGSVANIALGAPTGSLAVGQNLSGSVANVAVGAPLGAIAVRQQMAGFVSNIVLNAPSGAVVTGGGVGLAGSTANVSVNAPTGSVVTALQLTGTTANVAVGAPLGRLVFTPHSHRFVPPTMKQRPPDPQGERLWLYYGVDTGISVLRGPDGNFYQTQYPTTDEINEAQVAYIGGHEYMVNDAEYAALVAAGYLPNFPDEGGDGTYGSGVYGAGQYGN